MFKGAGKVSKKDCLYSSWINKIGKQSSTETCYKDRKNNHLKGCGPGMERYIGLLEIGGLKEVEVEEIFVKKLAEVKY